MRIVVLSSRNFSLISHEWLKLFDPINEFIDLQPLEHYKFIVPLEEENDTKMMSTWRQRLR